MCAILQKAAQESGLKTKFYFEDKGEAARVAGSFVPCGKLLLLADEETADEALALKETFIDFRVYFAVQGKQESANGLFSLPDDVRAAVAVGGRSIAAARFFCTLRGACLVAIPARCSAAEIFCPRSEGGYPVNEPDAVLFDKNFALGRAEGAAVAALSALYAEDIDIDGVFSGARKDAGYEMLRLSASLAVQVGAKVGRAPKESGRRRAGSGERLFESLCLQEIALMACPRLPSRAFYHLLSGKGAPLGECAFAALHYAQARYAALFENGRPRRYFVPDYAARARRAAEYVGEEAFANIKVPSAEECFAAAEIFEESRLHFAAAAEALGAYAEKIRRVYYAEGGKKPLFASGALEEAFSLAADLSPMLSVGALERDLGAVHMRGGAYGAKSGAKF